MRVQGTRSDNVEKTNFKLRWLQDIRDWWLGQRKRGYQFADLSESRTAQLLSLNDGQQRLSQLYKGTSAPNHNRKTATLTPD